MSSIFTYNLMPIHNNFLSLPSPSLYVEQANITLGLPQYVVVQRGETVKLGIEFVGYPLSPEGVQWELNGRPLPKAISSDTQNTSSLSLSGDNVELGDIIVATVHVHSNSTDSTNTTVIVIRKSLL